MRQGDFTKLAQEYQHRTGYSLRVLKALGAYMGAFRDGFQVADVGAGTGKLTENLLELGLEVTAVEPNQAMREEGFAQLGHQPRLCWREGSGEATGLPDNSVDWVLMGSSFHWTDQPKALAEFQRILRPGGFFTAVWNPRNLEQSELHQRIEAQVHQMAPNIERVSSGSRQYTQHLESTLLDGNFFTNLIFIEAPHEVHMSLERFLGAWRSVNDIQAQAGPEVFEKILHWIETEVQDLDKIVVPYKTRAWTVQSTRLA
ncbi:MAG: class I SAM-dependent methyltransferase [Candidatus Sericytochromatia bacterium]